MTQLPVTAIVAIALLMTGVPTLAAETTLPSGQLATPERFSGIADTATRSAALFTELGKVLTSPRCVNCHPASDRPRQGDDSHPHQPPV